MTKESILVTGGDGNIGSEVIRQLWSSKREDLKIVGGVRSITKKKGIDKRLDNHDLIEIEYDNPETVTEALKGIDKLFLLTPTHPKMIDFTSNLVNGARERKVKHIVKLSHIRADPDPDDEPQINITRLHRQAEKIIEESGIPFTFLRPNFFMENFVNFYLTKGQSSIYLPVGEGKVSFVDVCDIAAVAVQALTNNNDGLHSGKAYTITGPEALSYGDATGILSEHIGRKVSYVNISEDDARKAIRHMGMSDWHTNILLELLKLSRDGYLSSISHAVKEVTGKRPIPFSQFAQDYTPAFK
ncbi:MAG: NAD(P)H-binding protein [Nitrososphaeraceae archaeon]|nr:NAD(P)H-binding protein [Nitrososphaeraceae archaeon]